MPYSFQPANVRNPSHESAAASAKAVGRFERQLSDLKGLTRKQLFSLDQPVSRVALSEFSNLLAVAVRAPNHDYVSVHDLFTANPESPIRICRLPSDGESIFDLRFMNSGLFVSTEKRTLIYRIEPQLYSPTPVTITPVGHRSGTPRLFDESILGNIELAIFPPGKASTDLYVKGHLIDLHPQKPGIDIYGSVPFEISGATLSRDGTDLFLASRGTPARIFHSRISDLQSNSIISGPKIISPHPIVAVKHGEDRTLYVATQIEHSAAIGRYTFDSDGNPTSHEPEILYQAPRGEKIRRLALEHGLLCAVLGKRSMMSGHDSQTRLVGLDLSVPTPVHTVDLCTKPRQIQEGVRVDVRGSKIACGLVRDSMGGYTTQVGIFSWR